MLAFGRTRRVAPLFLKGVLVAFVVNVAGARCARAGGAGAGAGAHAATLFGMDVVAWLLLAVRNERGQVAEVREPAGATRRWLWLVAFPVVAAILLLPVLFWRT